MTSSQIKYVKYEWCFWIISFHLITCFRISQSLQFLYLRWEIQIWKYCKVLLQNIYSTECINTWRIFFFNARYTFITRLNRQLRIIINRQWSHTWVYIYKVLRWNNELLFHLHYQVKLIQFIIYLQVLSKKHLSVIAYNNKSTGHIGPTCKNILHTC